MALLLGRFRVPLTWVEILRRTFVDAVFKHNCLGMAAQLAYYFFFSLFPALLFLIAVASYFPLTTLIDEVVERSDSLRRRNSCRSSPTRSERSPATTRAASSRSAS